MYDERKCSHYPSLTSCTYRTILGDSSRGLGERLHDQVQLCSPLAAEMRERKRKREIERGRHILTIMNKLPTQYLVMGGVDLAHIATFELIAQLMRRAFGIGECMGEAITIAFTIIIFIITTTVDLTSPKESGPKESDSLHSITNWRSRREREDEKTICRIWPEDQFGRDALPRWCHTERNSSFLMVCDYRLLAAKARRRCCWGYCCGGEWVSEWVSACVCLGWAWTTCLECRPTCDQTQ